MKILINASLIKSGGALQYTLSLLNELKTEINHYFIVFISLEIKREINLNRFNKNFKFYIIKSNPIKMFFFGRFSLIRKIESKENPDIVYSPFGPSFYVSKKKQVEGFGDGWCYNPSIFSRVNLGLYSFLKISFLIAIKRKFIKKFTSKIIVETQDAKIKITKHLNIDQNKIVVIGNTHGNHFYDHKPIINDCLKDYKLLTLTSYYIHKNLEIIPKVLNELNKLKPNYFKFFLTLNDKDFAKFKGFKGIYNLGVLKVDQCPAAYNKVNAMFLPSLLETFSANYPESMYMKKIIITSDLDFAKDICANSAIYFNPLCPKDIASKILNISKNERKQKLLINNGLERLKSFPSSKIRANKVLDVLKSVYQKS